MGANMKHIPLQISGTSSSKKYYVPCPEECKVVGAYVTNTTAQGDGAATVTVGKNGASTTILSTDLKNTGARSTTTLQYTDSLADSDKEQIFDADTPIEVDVNLQTSSELVIELVVDPFVIGSGI